MDPNVAVAISNELRSDIQLGRLAPGAVLQQEQLAKRFQVSRQPIRMAIEILRASGWVTARTDRSVEVSGLSPQSLRDLMQVRVLLEREALTLALPHLTEKHLMEARHLEERLQTEADPMTVMALDCAFHTALYTPCGNPWLLKLIDDLRRENRCPYRDQPKDSPQRKSWGREHRKLLALCAAGDAEAAIAHLTAHIFHAEGHPDAE